MSLTDYIFIDFENVLETELRRMKALEITTTGEVVYRICGP
jgi:hypothetical protein